MYVYRETERQSIRGVEGKQAEIIKGGSKIMKKKDRKDITLKEMKLKRERTINREHWTKQKEDRN